MQAVTIATGVALALNAAAANPSHRFGRFELALPEHLFLILW